MDRYLVALYAHFLSLVGAVCTSAILHFTVSRARRAETVREARIAVALISRGAAFFPLFAAALLLTGSYMVHLRWPWSSGWIMAGIVGLVWLGFVGAVMLRPRLDALAARLRDAKDGPVDAEYTAAISDRVLLGGIQNNHAAALLVMFIMVAKPATAASFAILLLAPAFGVAMALLSGRSAVAGAATAPAPDVS